MLTTRRRRRRATSDLSATNGTTYYYKVSAVERERRRARSRTRRARRRSPLSRRRPAHAGRQLQPRQREPALRRGALDERDHRPARAASTSTRTSWPARSRRPAPPGATTPSSGRTSRCGRESRRFPARTTQLRLYARLQSRDAPGTCCARIRASGADEVWLERFNGGLTTLLTIPSGARGRRHLLLRAKGSTIEAWRLPSGGSWSRLGFVQDSTYTGGCLRRRRHCAGRRAASTTSVRGRSAAAPPDTTPPTDPTNLQASAVSSSQINLSWTASTDAGGLSVYRIERCSGVSCVNFAELTTVPGNQTTFQNTSLTASTSYTYRVRADDTATPRPTQSGYSNLVVGDDAGAARHHASHRPDEPAGKRGQLDPDQPLVDGLDRRRRSQRVPDRALLGRELRQLRRAHDRPRQPDDLPGHEPDRLHLLHLPRACRRHGHARQRQRLLEPRRRRRRWRRPTPRLPPTRRTCWQARSRRARSTSRGRPRPTRAASACTGSSAARA